MKKIPHVILLAIGLLLLLGIGLTFVSVSPNTTNVVTSNPPYAPAVSPTVYVNPSSRVSLEGEIICLPHKNTSGGQTMECAIGLKATDGNNYIVDTNLMSATAPELVVGDTMSANGTITPIENLSTDRWMNYDVQGIFSVTDLMEVK